MLERRLTPAELRTIALYLEAMAREGLPASYIIDPYFVGDAEDMLTETAKKLHEAAGNDTPVGVADPEQLAAELLANVRRALTGLLGEPRIYTTGAVVGVTEAITVIDKLAAR